MSGIRAMGQPAATPSELPDYRASRAVRQSTGVLTPLARSSGRSRKWQPYMTLWKA